MAMSQVQMWREAATVREGIGALGRPHLLRDFEVVLALVWGPGLLFAAASSRALVWVNPAPGAAGCRDRGDAGASKHGSGTSPGRGETCWGVPGVGGRRRQAPSCPLPAGGLSGGGELSRARGWGATPEQHLMRGWSRVSGAGPAGRGRACCPHHTLQAGAWETSRVQGGSGTSLQSVRRRRKRLSPHLGAAGAMF